MKRIKHRNYQTPRVREACLEVEGIFCQSLRVLYQVDESDNANTHYLEDGTTPAEPFNIEF